jgi:hypothetical protein
MLVRAFLTTTVVASLATGCGGDEPPEGNQGEVVGGVTSELRAQVDIARLDARVTSGETVLLQRQLAADLAFPLELPSGLLDDGAPVALELTAFGATGPALVTRRAETEVVAGRKLLLPVRLQAACAGNAAPSCGDGETCIGGACASPHIEATQLGDYQPGWGATPDACKPSGGGAPVVIVGRGQADYLPMEDGEVAQVEQGPQGGFHIWVAIRVKNLTQSGSITEVLGAFVDIDAVADPYKVVFTFDQAEGGYCKLPGLRFRLDSAEHGIEELLGKELDVTVKVTDKEGSTGEGTRRVKLSTDYI